MKPGQKCNLGYHLIKTTGISEDSSSGVTTGSGVGGTGSEPGGGTGPGESVRRSEEQTGPSLDKEDFRNFLP